MHRLQPVAGIRQRARHDHAHCVIEVGAAHLLFQVDRLHLAVWAGRVHRLVGCVAQILLNPLFTSCRPEWSMSGQRPARSVGRLIGRFESRGERQFNPLIRAARRTPPRSLVRPALAEDGACSRPLRASERAPKAEPHAPPHDPLETGAADRSCQSVPPVGAAGRSYQSAQPVGPASRSSRSSARPRSRRHSAPAASRRDPTTNPHAASRTIVHICSRFGATGRPNVQARSSKVDQNPFQFNVTRSKHKFCCQSASFWILLAQPKHPGRKEPTRGAER
jgi:hypothetical protein